jgi:glycosyltransferase involved in cell wall biosynthesis
MRIAHTESSNGWGGQEMRILKEAEGLRERGHTLIFAVQKGGGLAKEARKKGFIVYELSFKKQRFFLLFFQLLRIFSRHRIEVVNTHSSWDAWIAGISARFLRLPVLRTRHLSTPTKGGWNSRFLFSILADQVVTTSSLIIPHICRQAGISLSRCQMVATGVDPALWDLRKDEGDQFRHANAIEKEDFLVGTAAVLRSWKGIEDLLQAAALLKNERYLRFLLIGGGPRLSIYQQLVCDLNLSDRVIFTGHLEKPQSAMAALSCFALLSRSHEGISQAILQAAYLKKPLIATSVGGLPEVCLPQETGLLVPPQTPQQVAEAILFLYHHREIAEGMGEAGHRLVKSRFLMQHTLDQMEQLFSKVILSKKN